MILGIAKDNKSSIITKIQRGLAADLIITTGGISQGDYDLVKDVLTDMGRSLYSK